MQDPAQPHAVVRAGQFGRKRMRMADDLRSDLPGALRVEDGRYAAVLAACGPG